MPLAHRFHYAAGMPHSTHKVNFTLRLPALAAALALSAAPLTHAQPARNAEDARNASTVHIDGRTNDVHLSIVVATNVFQSESSSVCITTLLNSSTNTIVIDPASPQDQPSQLGIFLSDDTGEIYRLTPWHSAYLGPHPTVDVNPGQSFNETNAVTFNAAIKPGDYSLYAERLITMNGKYFSTWTNPIKVHVKKASVPGFDN